MVRALVIFVVFVLQFLPSHADSVQNTLKLQAKYKTVYQDMVFPPPEKVFEISSELSRFYDQVKKGECGTALIELALTFHVVNPELPDPTDFSTGGFGAWHFIIKPRDYPELQFCATMKELERLDREIKDKKISNTLRFSQFEQTWDPNISRSSPLNRRMNVVGDLFRLVLFDYAPAQVALVKLSEKGDAVRLTPDYAYFLLSRAKQLGYTASDLAPLLERAAAALTATERETLAPRIETGDWPREERRVID